MYSNLWNKQKIKFRVSEALTKIATTDCCQNFPKVKARCESHVSQDQFILLRLAFLTVRNAQRESCWQSRNKNVNNNLPSGDS